MALEELIIEAAYTAAAAQERQEESRGNPIDKVEHPEDCTKTDVTRLAEKDEAVFEKKPLPGYPKGERERREQWLTNPRRTRIAIRRMHDAFGHPVKSALLNLLRALVIANSGHMSLHASTITRTHIRPLQATS